MPRYKSSKDPLGFESPGPKAHAVPDATTESKRVSKPAEKFDPGGRVPPGTRPLGRVPGGRGGDKTGGAAAKQWRALLQMASAAATADAAAASQSCSSTSAASTHSAEGARAVSYLAKQRAGLASWGRTQQPLRSITDESEYQQDRPHMGVGAGIEIVSAASAGASTQWPEVPERGKNNSSNYHGRPDEGGQSQGVEEEESSRPGSKRANDHGRPDEGGQSQGVEEKEGSKRAKTSAPAQPAQRSGDAGDASGGSKRAKTSAPAQLAQRSGDADMVPVSQFLGRLLEMLAKLTACKKQPGAQGRALSCGGAGTDSRGSEQFPLEIKSGKCEPASTMTSKSCVLDSAIEAWLCAAHDAGELSSQLADQPEHVEYMVSRQTFDSKVMGLAKMLGENPAGMYMTANRRAAMTERILQRVVIQWVEKVAEEQVPAWDGAG